MLQNEQIAFIGGGMMAQAMIAGIVEQGLIVPSQIIASDPLKHLGEALTANYGINYTSNNLAAIEKASIVILAIKPQYASQVFDELHGKVDDKGLVLSIMAGVPIAGICDGLGVEKAVRVMPNTPAQVGKGMSVWTATSQVSEVQHNQAGMILGALGKEIYVDQEYYLDMATAMSGSGPAYVFLFLEAFIDAGVHLGFARPIAQELALQTMEGAIAFARQHPHHPAELRNMVTSPGGTTADALYELEKGGVRATLSKAVYAAYKKSIALGE